MEESEINVVEGRPLERIVNLESRSVGSSLSHDSMFVNPDPSLLDMDVLSPGDMIELSDNLTYNVVERLHKTAKEEERLVYLVRDSVNKKKFVAVTNAENEHDVLKKLSGIDRKIFPRIFAYSKETYQILIMEYCGENYCSKSEKVSVKELVALSLDVITQLEILSTFNLVHRNISTRTICKLGEVEKSGLLENTLIGFYLVRENNVETNSDVLLKNPLFCSLEVSEGRKFTFYDDLMSLLYVLCYLEKGDLPWSSETLNSLSVKGKKKTFNVVEELPKELREFGQAVLKVERSGKPIYSDLSTILKDISV